MADFKVNTADMSKRLVEQLAEEHCIGCDQVFYGIPDETGGDYCPFCDTYNLLCNLCTIQPDCQLCPYSKEKKHEISFPRSSSKT